MFARLSITLCLLASLTSLGVLAEHIVVRDRHVTLPTAKKVHTTGMANVLKVDQSRAKGLKHRIDNAGTPRQRRASAIEHVPITSYATQYLINVTIGNPPQPCMCLFSTRFTQCSGTLIYILISPNSFTTSGYRKREHLVRCRPIPCPTRKCHRHRSRSRFGVRFRRYNGWF